MRTKRTGSLMRLTAMVLGVLLAAALLFALCYRYDNKYTAPGKQPVDGALRLTQADLQAHPKTFLVRDWELYRGRLLTPADFATNPPQPDELVFIGQYGGFEGGGETSPHGSATYRLRLTVPPGSYSLELPEIYSAYRLYVNGTLLQQMGDPDPAAYRAETANSAVTVQTDGAVELLLAVSDYSYFYSGLTYPPAFGLPGAVASYRNLRFGLRMAAVVAALCIGLISLGIRVLAKPLRGGKADRDLTLLYGLLCFCFVGYIGYPVVKTLAPGGLQWYYVENFCYGALFVLVGLMQYRISGWGGRATAALVIFGSFVCCCSLLVPWFLSGNLALLLAYSGLLKLYTYAFALLLTVSTVWCLYRRVTYSAFMTAGMVVFDCALVFDRLLPDYEPILFGWFLELAGAVLVALIGVLMAQDVAGQYRRRLVLEEQVSHASHMLELQSAYYPVLLEKEQEAKAARHDLRHHFLMLRELASQGNLAALTDYLDEYNAAYLQPGDSTYCKHYVVNMLLRLYEQRAKAQSTGFTANIQVPEDIPVGNVDLCVIISNLMENALEACRPLPQHQRWVHIGVIYNVSRLSIAVDNSYDGWLQMKDGQFLSRKRKQLAGVGLLSVQAVSARYQGSTRFYPDAQRQEFHSEIMLMARRPEQAEQD